MVRLTEDDGRGTMSSTSRWWVAVPLAVGLALAGCGGDEESGGSAGADADASADPASTADAVPDSTAGGEDATGANDGARSSAGVMILGDEEIAIDLLCYFEEQPRAGLGGVFTHTAQGRGTNAEGEDVVLDLSRARAEDGTVEDDVIVDIGDPFGDDLVRLRVGGPEGLIEFRDESVSASGVDVSTFGAEPVSLSFDVSCP
jgi:hypothetical protein